MRLTQDQREIVELDEGCFLVQAPPGAGKTTVLTERIARILRNSPAATFRILALTFTTKAAENLKERIVAELPKARARVYATTFHAFALDELRAYGAPVGFSSKITPYSNSDETRFVLELALEREAIALPNDARARRERISELVRAISVHKRELSPPAPDDESENARAYRAYNEILREYGKCDFDDLLYSLWRLLVEEPSITNHLRRIHRYIMVDEAQDTSRVQYELLRVLCGETHRNVMLVADENQAIHAYAGASTEWLRAFQAAFGATPKSLRSNFRSAGSIVAAAKALCPSEVEPRTYATGWIGFTELPSVDEEAVLVVDWLAGLIRRGVPSSWLETEEDVAITASDCAVLARNHSNLSAVRAELERREIASLYLGAAKGVVETNQASALLALLQLIQNPRDGVARARLRTLVKVESEVEPTCPFDVFMASLEVTRWGKRVAEVHRELIQLRDVSQLVSRSIEILRAVDKPQVVADADELERRWVAYRRELLPTQRTLDGFIGHLALAGRNAVAHEGVRLFSIHAAKGLEFKVVALIGMNEGTLPDWRTETDDEQAEEARLAYVAVTRAARGLLVTRPTVTVNQYGKAFEQRCSRYIAGMGLSTTTPDDVRAAARACDSK